MTCAVEPWQGNHSGGSTLNQLVREAVANLWGVRQRSLLAVLGLAVGTAAVVATLNIGHNAQQEAVRRFQSMGANILYVQPDAGQSTISIPQKPIATLASGVPQVEAIAPVAIGAADLRLRGPLVWAQMLGVTPAFMDITRLRVRSGRLLTAGDDGQTHVLIGSALAAPLSGDTGRPVIPGDTVRIGPYRYSVVGILDDIVGNPMLPVDLNNAVIVPLPGMRRTGNNPDITGVLVRMTAGADDVAVATAVEQHFAAASPRARVIVARARQAVAAMREQIAIYANLLLAVGAIALVVGGVGVMNVLLIGVLERRREIGLRLALGARPRDIRNLFLAESVVLSAVGGLLGGGIGVMGAAAIATGFGWTFALAPEALPLGALVAGGVGLAFGVWPASNAARTDPIVALRSA